MTVNTHVVKSTAKKAIWRSRKRGYGGKAVLQLAWWRHRKWFWPHVAVVAPCRSDPIIISGEVHVSFLASYQTHLVESVVLLSIIQSIISTLANKLYWTNLSCLLQFLKALKTKIFGISSQLWLIIAFCYWGNKKATQLANTGIIAQTVFIMLIFCTLSFLNAPQTHNDSNLVYVLGQNVLGPSLWELILTLA